ncbi:MAG: hypothetical protein JNJ83_09920 [Verrucomicrobiaceae bacterium]|nr:hypothetical protein [Verrucomicrobiaceae bacterium]
MSSSDPSPHSSADDEFSLPDLPEPPPDMPVRPVVPVDWAVVEAYFRPMVLAYQQRPDAEEQRLASKVYVPFEM